MRRLALLGLVLAACSSGTPAVPTTPPPIAGVTAPPVAEIQVRLSDIEAAAARGVSVQVEQTVRLTGTEPVRMTLPFDRPVMLQISYVIGEMPVEPAWSQQVTAAEDGSTVLIVEQPWRQPVEAGEPVVLAWQAGGDSAGYLEQLAAAPGLTVTSPLWWTLDAEGSLAGEADPQFVTDAHKLGIDVWPYVTNGFEPARTRLAIGDEAGRRRLAGQLSEAARLSGADGVNVDFEAFSVRERDEFTAFVVELGSLVHEWGGLVSVDITAGMVPAAVLALNRYDRRALAEAADYLALMAYDEYNRTRPSGPTASLGWTEDSLYWLLRHADPHQVLLGIPLYGRIWDPEKLSQPTTATIGTVVELAAANDRAWDPEFGVDRVELADGRYFWAEDYETLRARLALAQRAGIAGTAAWRLGFDTAEVWTIISP